MPTFALVNHFMRDKTTSPASISPAQEGTQETEAGMLRRPGGGASKGVGVRAGSVLKRTL